MTFSEKYGMMRNQARADGLKLGLFWVFSFALFIGNFHYAICGIFWMATMVFTPFLVGMFTRRYADTSLEGVISYRHAYAHGFLTVFYAALILAITQWAYFAYLDNGFVVNRYIGMLSDNEFQKSMEAMGYSKKTVEELVSALRELRPIDIALEMMWSNVIAGFIISLTTALYASTRRHYRPRQ